MNSQDPWSKLFSKSSFYAIKKEDLDNELLEYQKKIQFDPIVNTYHESRKKEYLLGRLCASKAHQLCFGEDLFLLPSNKDRSPAWPLDVLGSISHNQHWVGAAVAKASDLLGVGIDFEVMGRTKSELAGHIRSSKDLLSHPQLSTEELLTLIFSTKESLYKALYPTVQKFFGFEDAALRELDVDRGEFVIELINQISLNFGPNSRQIFKGRFTVENNNCLTALEVFS